MNANYRISGQRTSLTSRCNTFFNCREEVLRNCAAHNFFIENIGFTSTRWCEADLNMTILSVTACLLLILIFRIRRLHNGFTEGYSGLLRLNIHLVFIVES